MTNCIFCGDILEDEAILDHLANVCPGSSADGFKCPKCPMFFPDFEALSGHYAVCVSVPALNEPPPELYGSHYCLYCRGYDTNDPDAMARHIPICLETCQWLVCQKCEVVIGDLRALNLHMEGCYANPPSPPPPPALPLVLPPPPPPLVLPPPPPPIDAAPPTEQGPSGSGKRKRRGKKKNKNRKN